MLKLKRRKNETLTIYTTDGPIVISVDKTVHMLIQAPKSVRIIRSEAKIK